jgi:Tfp pilus assembly protein PilN
MLQAKQSINLYLPKFRPPQLSQAILLLLKVSVIGFISLLILIGLLFLGKLYLGSQLQQTKIEQVKLNQELVKVIAQLPNTIVDKNLLMQIEREEKLLAKQKRVISFLRQDSISDSSSFTSLVEQLSQQNIKGIWLSKFAVTNQGQDIQLFGYAKTPDRVSDYLTMLGTQPAYRGRAFKQIHISRGEQAWNEFFLSTRQAEIEGSNLIQETLSGSNL